MEDVKGNKSVVTSYRVKEDTKNKIKVQLQQLGLTQEEYFNKVVSIMELEKVKQNNIFAVNTTELQELTQRIYDLFVGLCEQGNSFLSNKDAQIEELNNKYKERLLNKEDIIIKLKNELQEVYSNFNILQNENEEYKNNLLSIRVDYDKKISQLEDNLKDKDLIVEEYKTKNDMLLSDLAQYKQYRTEVEEYKSLLADSQTKNIKLNDDIKDMDITINELNKQIENNNNEYVSVVDRLKKEHELNIKLAVSEVREELNNKLSQEQLKHNKDIEEYQLKYKNLLEELERERAK